MPCCGVRLTSEDMGEETVQYSHATKAQKATKTEAPEHRGFRKPRSQLTAARTCDVMPARRGGLVCSTTPEPAARQDGGEGSVCEATSSATPSLRCSVAAVCRGKAVSLRPPKTNLPEVTYFAGNQSEGALSSRGTRPVSLAALRSNEKRLCTSYKYSCIGPCQFLPNGSAQIVNFV